MNAPAANTLAIGNLVQRLDPCDLCGQQQFEVVSLVDRKQQPMPTGVCTHCGLVSHLSLPTDADLATYYGTQYRHDYHGEITPSARRVMRAWKNGQSILARLSGVMKPGDRVFEVGAGIGCTVKSFELAGYQSSGIEPGEGFHKFSREQLHARIACESVYDQPPMPTYDVILLVHVIEHFNHPAKALRHMRQMLRPGGRLYVECPNMYAPHASPGHLFHYAHVHNFTPSTLAMMGQACGLKLEKQINADRDRNLMMVFSRGEREQLRVNPKSYWQTKEALNRYSNFTYNARPNYLAHRARVMLGHLVERIGAKKQMKQLIARCGQHAAGKVAARKAA